MAAFGNVETKLAGIADRALRSILTSVFEYILKDVRFGRAGDGDSSQNFGGGFFYGTTDGVANTEFTLEHSFGRVPYLAFQVIPLNTANVKIVRLTNSKAADANRLYLKSPDTGADFVLYIEG